MSVLELVDFQLALQQFLAAGGWVLYVILGICMLLWTLLIERVWFKWGSYPQFKARKQQSLTESSPFWLRQSIRCDMEQVLEKNLSLIKTLIALCPLVGLLGTVTGMIQVFDTLALNGTGNPRLMAAGVAKATLPTLAGMSVAVSGLLVFNRLARWSELEKQKMMSRVIGVGQ